MSSPATHHDGVSVDLVQPKEVASQSEVSSTHPNELKCTAHVDGNEPQSDRAEPTVEGEQPPDQLQGRTVRGFKWALVCMALYVSIFLYGLDTTIAADIQGSIVERFGHIDQLAWIGAGFFLGSAAAILPVGAAYTSFDMKWVYIASVALFEVGSAVCGAAPNMSALIIGRVITGIGGSGTYLGALNIVSSLTTPKERGTYVTGIGFNWGLGAVLGPVIGGSFSDSLATWRWAFYINLVIGAVVAPIFLFSLPSLPTATATLREKLRRMDWLGFLLSAAMWVSFTMALTMPGGQWQWSHDGRTVAIVVVFGIIVILYVLQQVFVVLTTPETRSFPIHLLKSRTQLLLYVGTSANITVLFVVIYFIPIYFEFVKNDSALMAAVRLLPYVSFTVVLNLLAGYLLARVRYYMPIYMVAGILITLGGSLMMVYLTPSTSPSHIYGFSVLLGIGTGLTLQIGYPIATLKTKPQNMGDAIGLQNVSQIGSAVIALVVAGLVFQSIAVANLSAVLDGTGYSAEDIRAAVAGAQSTLFKELGERDPALRDLAILAITEAMQKPFILVIVAGAATIVSAAAMRIEPLFGEVTVA